MKPDDSSDDGTAFAEVGESLRVELIRALPEWVRTTVMARLATEPDAEQLEAVIAGIVDSVNTRMRRLVSADIDEPLSGPLEIVRQSAVPLTTLLVELGAEARARDPYASGARPEDVFDIGPMSFLEFDEAVQDAGIRWGAAKAYVHMRRRRASPPHDS